MNNKAVSLFALMTILSTSLSGCIRIPCEWNDSCHELECGTHIESEGDWVGMNFPSFATVDQYNQSWNLSSMSGIVWVAYFSAPWCHHCEATLDSYDQAIPEGNLLIFNKEFRDDYTNMTDWQESSEEHIGRNISRPFMNAPELAESLEVDGIPMAFVVNETGVVVDFTLGERTDSEELGEMYTFYTHNNNTQ